MADTDTPLPSEDPPAGKEEMFYLVNRLTDAQTRVQRLALPRTLRGKRVLHLFGRALHPARNYLYSRTFLLAHRSELQPLEQQGMVGFRRMNMEWASIRDGLPPGVQRQDPPVPFAALPERPIGDMPVEPNTSPPEGGFHREPPKAWSKGVDPAALDSLQRALDAGLLRSKPDPSKVLKREEEPEALAPASPVHTPDAFEEMGPPRPELPSPSFRKRAALVEADVHDPFADPEE